MKTLAVLAALSVAPLSAQLTVEQKLTDFQQLVAIFAKQYAPYEWKRDVIGHDLLEIGPWMDRIRKSKDDFEFLEIEAEYVSNLRDGHVSFNLPSNFAADSGLFIDLYGDRVLVDGIDRRILPASSFPIQEGDELIGVDGKTTREWMNLMNRFSYAGNERARRRGALDLIVFRPQAIYPRAHETPQRSRFQFRRQNGLIEAYDVTWVKAGIPITALGPVPNPVFTANAPEDIAIEPRPAFRGFPELRRARIQTQRAVRGIGSIEPVFVMPTGFSQRLGRGRDLVFSGTFPNSGRRIGFIRVGFMSLLSNPFAGSQQLSQLVSEVRFMQANTDGLIVDVMRNPGGDTCFAQDLSALLIPTNFEFPGAEIRATREWILRYEGQIEELKSAGSATWITDLLTAMLGDIRGAYSENRGRTGALPTCDLSLEVEPLRDQRGTLLSYTKPLMLLVDDFTASAAEMFAAAIQDNRRGIVFGMPTMGAGGSVGFPQPAGAYAETSAVATASILVRPRLINSSQYPAAPYIENIGIRPDVEGDLMTAGGFDDQGRQFVQQFTAAMVRHLGGSN